MWVVSSTWDIYIIYPTLPYTPRLREHHARGTRENVRAWVQEEWYEVLFCTQRGHCTQEFISAVVTCKRPVRLTRSSQSSFHSTGTCYAGFGGGGGINSPTQPWTLWTMIITSMARYAHWCNSSINVIEVTNHFQVGLKVCSTGENTCLYCETSSRVRGLNLLLFFG